jgi:hypothetical protein
MSQFAPAAYTKAYHSARGFVDLAGNRSLPLGFRHNVLSYRDSEYKVATGTHELSRT